MSRYVLTATAMLWFSACGDDTLFPTAPPSAPDTVSLDDIQVLSDTARTDDSQSPPSEDARAPSDIPEDIVDADSAASGQEDTTTDDIPDVGPPIPPCAPGYGCDDENPCTANDQCDETGTCVGIPFGCNDGRACTTDICLGNGECRFDIQADTCLIGNICYAPGDQHIQNACVVCDPTVSNTEWALAPDETPCAGDSLCIETGACINGQCNGALVSCDDGNACTDDSCNPVDGCMFLSNFDACDDGDACTVGDACSAGQCEPGQVAISCDDNEPCTLDFCGPEGCVYPPVSGPCSDGNACTVNDECIEGECVSGSTKNCDDGNLCTIDTCDIYVGCTPEFVSSPCCVAGTSLCDDQDPCTIDACDEIQGTCVYDPSNAACDDGDPCTTLDGCSNGLCLGTPVDCDDGNPCTASSCNSALGGCQYAPLPGSCDDDNACTMDDVCIGGTCTGSPVGCNDNNPCTTDGCHPVDGCVTDLQPGPCDDFNACTANTVCTEEGCIGDPVQCDDNNPCTNDVCNPTAGCQYQPIAAPCDDGLDCSTGDTCIAGQCTADISECGCIPTYSDLTSKLTSLLIGEGGSIGQGLDVDGDASTCAPAGQCSDGVDNSMSVFAALANPELGDGFEDAGVILLFNHVDFSNTGQPYLLNFFAADDTSNTCDVQTENCPYLLDAGSVDPDTCTPLISFDNTTVVGTALTAGGLGYDFPFSLPVEGINLSITMNNAQLKAEVTYADGKIATMDGVLAGAVAKETIEAAIDQIPDSEFPPEIPKDTVKGLIGLLVTNDIDTDGDGTPDAASIGLTFTAIQGTIIGIDL